MKKLKNIISVILTFVIYFDMQIFIQDKLSPYIDNSIVLSFIYYIFIIIVLFFFFRKELIKSFKPFIKNFFKYLKKYLPKLIITYIIVYAINIIIFLITKETSTNQDLNVSLLKQMPFLYLITVGIFAPFVEELLFRANFKKIFKNKMVYIIISSLIFGAMHMLVATSLTECLYVITYSILGGFLAYTYIDTDNIYTSMMFHSLNNTCVSIIILLGAFL